MDRGPCETAQPGERGGEGCSQLDISTVFSIGVCSSPAIALLLSAVTVRS